MRKILSYTTNPNPFANPPIQLIMAEETTLYNSIPADSQKLESSQDWPDWIRTLEYHATNRGIWNLIDPAAPDAANPHIKPSIPTIHELVSERQEMATTIYNLSTALWEKTPEALRDAANKPNLRTVTAEEVRDEHDRLVATAAARVTATIETTRAYQHIQNWVDRTVDKSFRALAMQHMIQNGGFTIQGFVRFLKERLEPSQTSLASLVRQEYRAVMEQVKSANVSKEQWMKDWEAAYRKAEGLSVTEIEGPLATKDWLRAIQARMAPVWASSKLAELVEQEVQGLPTKGVTYYARLISALIDEEKFSTGGGKQLGGVFYTERGSPSSGAPEKPNQSSKKDCPCGEKHPWPPANCYTLRLAVTGSVPSHATKRAKQLSSDAREKVKAQFASSKWFKVRKTCQEKWGAAPAAPTFPGSINAAVISAHTVGGKKFESSISYRIKR